MKFNDLYNNSTTQNISMYRNYRTDSLNSITHTT